MWRKDDPVRNSRVALFRRPTDRPRRRQEATQIRRTLFQEGLDRNKYLPSIYIIPPPSSLLAARY